MIAYEIELDWEDDGTFDAGDSLTADVLAVSWRLGLTAPYQRVAPPGEATIVLLSRDGRYAPETGQRAVPIGKSLRIRSTDSGTPRLHFTGQVASVEVAAGADGTDQVTLHAHTADIALYSERWAETTPIPPLINTDAGAVVRAVLIAAPVRRAALATWWVLEGAHTPLLDSSTRLADILPMPAQFDVGISRFPYATVEADATTPNTEASSLLRAAIASEGGRLFTDEAGTLVFQHRHRALAAALPVFALTNNMTALDYRFGDDGVNAVQVHFMPRAVLPSNTVLWMLPTMQAIPPGVRQFTTHFRTGEGQPLAALAPPTLMYSANTQPDGSGQPVTLSVSMTAGAQLAVLRFHNESGQTTYLLAGARLEGVAVTPGERLTAEARDTPSITLYGEHALRFDAPLLASADESDGFARFELLRRPPPRGMVRQVTLTARQHPTALEVPLFSRISLTEAASAHGIPTPAVYTVIGAAHKISKAGTVHSITWTLEPVSSLSFWEIGIALLDSTTRAAY